MEGPLGVCPQCQHQEMILAGFNEFFLRRTCRECGHDVQTQPPKLEKKLVYLDQWVISNFVNALDPEARSRKSGRVDPVWPELYRQLDRMVKLHVIACPESPIHQRESLVVDQRDLYREVYEHLSSGIRFKEPTFIHASQLFDAFNRVVRRNTDESDIWANRQRAVHGSLSEWCDDIRIRARFPFRMDELIRENASRDSADILLGQDSQRWRQQPGKSYEDWFDYHRRDLTNVALTCFERVPIGPYAAACRSMVERLVSDGVAEDVATGRVREFLKSEEATEVPYCEVSALLYAAMSKKIADEGQRADADHGHYHDIEAIAAYLPYCDAICVDSFFAEVLNKGQVRRRVAKYKVKVFAPRQRHDFIRYLQGLEAEMPSALRDTVIGVYGSSWVKAYDTILEYHREKKSRDKG